MDEEEYKHIKELADSGDFVDFEIPKDAPSGKRFSSVVSGEDRGSRSSDMIPVDLADEFGG